MKANMIMVSHIVLMSVPILQ